MNKKIKSLLENKGENHILPFLWMKGESEQTIREYMAVISEQGIGAVCVESRPHPDFAGEGWWRELDVVLDEAKKRDMKVWILDDSHFPTGYANGAMEKMPPELARRHIAPRIIRCESGKEIKLAGLDRAEELKLSFAAKTAMLYSGRKQKHFDDDRLLGVFAVEKGGEMIDLTGEVKNSELRWRAPAGEWSVCAMHITGNRGAHRDYINTLDRESCRVQIDAVYEPHWERYKDEFGKSIAGFFSDEPELGNGILYQSARLGEYIDQPWSRELEAGLKEKWGDKWLEKLPYLWLDGENAPRIRYSYMNVLTRLAKECFSDQLGTWCRERGVEYIGHVIEDNNSHARTGPSLGHYFRGLAGQDMSGIDDIGGQVLPYGEDLVIINPFNGKRDGEFFHFALGKLAESLAALNPRMKGRAMCEIFGNYGWKEGVRLEKYLADHFLVRGVNNYVPHAFSMKEFPDTDCPPHFYAHGHNPQYRHFGCLCRYMNRVSTMISGGRHIAPVAILYNGDSEWSGECMLSQKPGRILAENQIEYDFVPQDVFAEADYYNCEFGKGFRVNTQEYSVLVVPCLEYVTKCFGDVVNRLSESGFPVLFIDSLPGAYSDSAEPVSINAEVVTLDRLVSALPTEAVELRAAPASKGLRYIHYRDESDIWFIVNENKESYRGELLIAQKGDCYIYDAWNNRLLHANSEQKENGTALRLELLPLESCMLVFDSPEVEPGEPLTLEKNAIELKDGWRRSFCDATEYPRFSAVKKVSLPDKMQQEHKKFSGFVRYERKLEKKSNKTILEITEAHEGVELFVNGVSAGIQIIPPFCYDISAMLSEGENDIAIEVASTLERQVGRKGFIAKVMQPKPSALSGITGTVRLHLK